MDHTPIIPRRPPSELVMLDLFSGLGGASRAMRERGWRVIAVDCLAWLRPDIVADVSNLPLRPFPVDLLWFSPPCTEYSRWDQPWFSHITPPDLTLYHVCRGLVDLWRPRFYVIENVRGAQRWWGKATVHYRSRYLWTDLPMLPIVDLPRRSKKSVLGTDPLAYWKRSEIPYPLSYGIATAVEAFYA